ncbi:MAG: DNA helicase UvrD [Candidatus Sungbacteria bacterium]|nr:DNA helicase UvrD [Candidatus Sungbacteria bacterium]
MRIIADLHIHSPYSRAVSKEMTLENLDVWARMKGITVMGTGDFTHPKWMKEIKTKLEPAEPGLYQLRTPNSELRTRKTRFLLTVEISSIYKKNGKTRRIHNLIFSPSVETAEKINAALGWRGNLKSDGRPILGLDSRELAKIVLDIDPKAMIVCAHVWTPWFSLFGSMSGFDTIKECFDDYAKYIRLVETGLSSSPAMNWRVSQLDQIGIISNSDSHSLQRIGREANVFDCNLSYAGIVDAMTSRDPKKFLFTVEFYPEEGKYHYDGHRQCNFSSSPEETREHKGLCPVCGKPVTVGVLNRVEKLADRPLGFTHAGSIPYKSLVPLDEIIAEGLGMGTSAKRVKAEYRKLIDAIGSEFAALVDAPRSDLASATTPEIVQGIIAVREGKVRIEPGYDGEYGKVKIFAEGETPGATPQGALF